jgi:hypothetical protein
LKDKEFQSRGRESIKAKRNLIIDDTYYKGGDDDGLFLVGADLGAHSKELENS